MKWSSDVTSRAHISGWRSGTRATAVPTRSVVVAAAIAWQVNSGSYSPGRWPAGSAGASVEPGDGGYGYIDSYCSKNTTCSGTQIEWNPRPSAAWATSRTYAGPRPFPPSNASTNPISQAPISGTLRVERQCLVDRQLTTPTSSTTAASHGGRVIAHTAMGSSSPDSSMARRTKWVA